MERDCVRKRNGVCECIICWRMVLTVGIRHVLVPILCPQGFLSSQRSWAALSHQHCPVFLSLLPSSPGQIPVLPSTFKCTVLPSAICEHWHCFLWITVIPHRWSPLFVAIYPSSCEFRQRWHFVFFQLLIYRIGKHQITSAGTMNKKNTQFISSSLFTMTYWYFYKPI